MHTQNWTRKSFFQKKTHQKDQQNHSEQKRQKKKKMGIFSTRIMKNAAETKSISQNSNKIIQKKFKLFKKIIKLFSVCTFKKTLTTTAKLCFLILSKILQHEFQLFVFTSFYDFKKYCEKKNGIKKFSTKTLHVIAL